MKAWQPMVAIVVLALLAAGGWVWWQYRQVMAPAAAAPLDAAQAAGANHFLDLLDAGQYAAAHVMLDAKAREAVAQDKLAEVWETLPRQLGARRSRGPTRGIAVHGVALVGVRLEFGMLALDARIGFDPDGLIHTFRVVPAPPIPAAAPSADDPFVERELAVAGLGGTLTLPRGAGPFPALVLVHGSGPHDRDETIGPNRPFLDLARGLAARGIAVLRYEKRTLARPADFAAGDYTVDDEVVADAVAAIAALRGVAEVDPRRVFLGGHSLGAMMAPRIAQRVRTLTGLVLLAAPARSLLEVVPAQMRYLAALDGTVDAQEQAQIAQFDAQAAATAAMASPDTPATGLLLGLPAHYWLDLRDYDPVSIARGLPQPLLVMQGERDYQVTPAEDFVRWRQAFADDPRATLKTYPTLNHLFIAGSGAPGPAEYMQAGHVAEQPIADIAQWIGARRTD